MSIKKIGILTASRTNNNGTDLQAAAMFYIFKRFCDKSALVEIIDYENKYLEKINKLFKRFSIKDFLKVPYRIFMNISHQSFRKNFWKRSSRKYNSKNFASIDNDYVGIIVGSDQVWNLNLTGGDLNFFLPNITNAKKCSYSPSFGVDDLSNFEKQYSISTLLNSFFLISTREETNVESLRQIGITATHTLDPIILAGDSFLNSIAGKKINQRFVLLYLIEDNDEAMLFAKEFAAIHNISLVSIGEPRHRRCGIYNKSFVSLEKWLAYIRDAEIVVTNSYHGVSTALTYAKQIKFFKLSNNLSNSRVISLYQSFGISLNDELNYGELNRLIETKKKKSYAFIESVVKGILNEEDN